MRFVFFYCLLLVCLVLFHRLYIRLSVFFLVVGNDGLLISILDNLLTLEE